MLKKIIWFIRALLKVKSEKLRVCGKVRLIGHNKDGSLAFDFERPNLITNAGFDLICNQIGLKDAQPVAVAWMAISNGAVGGADAEALAATETHRVAATYAHTHGTKIFTLTGTFTTVVAAVSYGCLNAAANGELLNTAGFTAITVDSLQIIMTGTLS